MPLQPRGLQTPKELNILRAHAHFFYHSRWPCRSQDKGLFLHVSTCAVTPHDNHAHTHHHLPSPALKTFTRDPPEHTHNVTRTSIQCFTLVTTYLYHGNPSTKASHAQNSAMSHVHALTSHMLTQGMAILCSYSRLHTNIVVFLCFKLAFLGTHRFQQNVFCLGSHATPVSKSSRKRKSVEGRLGCFSGDAWKGRVSFPSSVLWRKASPWSRLLARAAGKYSIVLCPGGKEISCVMFPKNLS